MCIAKHPLCTLYYIQLPNAIANTVCGLNSVGHIAAQQHTSTLLLVTSSFSEGHDATYLPEPQLSNKNHVLLN